MSDQDNHWTRPIQYDDGGPYNESITQEEPMTEQTPDPTESPAVSKLREAFDTARNAILEGTELAKLVAELRVNVTRLSDEVNHLSRDLEYLRGRNKELDEQVGEVRRQRDEALAELSQQRNRTNVAESDLIYARNSLGIADERNNSLAMQLDSARKERDDAMIMALEYETKLKAAEATLAKMREVMGIEEPKPEPKPEQPRAETGQFQSYDHGSQGQS